MTIGRCLIVMSYNIIAAYTHIMLWKIINNAHFPSKICMLVKIAAKNDRFLRL